MSFILPFLQQSQSQVHYSFSYYYLVAKTSFIYPVWDLETEVGMEIISSHPILSTIVHTYLLIKALGSFSIFLCFNLYIN